MPAAAVENAVHRLLDGNNDRLTVVCHHGRLRFAHFRNALNQDGAVRGHSEVLGQNVVGVVPGVTDPVDIVIINVCSVAAAVDKRGGVGAGVKCDRLAAVGDDRQGGDGDLREAVDIGLAVLRGREGIRVEGVGVGPHGVVSGAVGVAVAEDDGACAVPGDHGGAVHENGLDGVAAGVGDVSRSRVDGVHEARHGGLVVRGHIGDGLGQGDMEGEGPAVGVAGAVGIGIAIDDVALAAVEAGAVNGDGTRREGVVAGVGDGRQGDAVGGDFCETVDGGLAAGIGDCEVFGNNMVGVRPRVIGVVDCIGEGIDGVAAAAVADKRRAGKRERDGAAADFHNRSVGGEDIAGAVDGGVGVGHGGEGCRRHGVDERPRVGVASAVGVGVVVSHGAVSVGSHVNDWVARVCNSDHLAPACVCERVGRGLGGLANAGDDIRTVLRDGQSGQLDDIGVDPVVRMVGAVCECVGVGHGALAVGHAGVNGGQGVADLGAAAVGHGRDMGGRLDSLAEAADGIKAVGGGDGEVFGRDMVGVVPDVVCAVYIISIDECGVAASAHNIAGIGACGQFDRRAAVGDIGQGGGVHLGEAVDGRRVVLRGGEGIRVEGVGVGPDGVVSGAVGVLVAEDNGAGAVGVEGGGAVHEDGDDGIAAEVGDGRCGRCRHIHEAGHGCAAVGGYIGDDVRHHDVEGERPSRIHTCAILVSVRKGLCSGTILDIRSNSRTFSCQHNTAGVGDDGKSDGIDCCLAFAVYGVCRCRLTDGECGGSVDQDVLCNGGAVSTKVGDGVGAEYGEMAVRSERVVFISQ